MSHPSSHFSHFIPDVSKSSVFAISVERRILGGNLVWLVMFCVGLYGAWHTARLEEDTEED